MHNNICINFLCSQGAGAISWWTYKGEHALVERRFQLQQKQTETETQFRADLQSAEGHFKNLIYANVGE